MLGGDLVSRQGASEREYRTVVGRAYYGAFLAAREKAAISSKTAAVHQKTADYYLGKNQSFIFIPPKCKPLFLLIILTHTFEFNP